MGYTESRHDRVSSLCELLEKDKSFIIHERNVKIPLAEIFKVKSRLAPEIMIEVFRFKDRSYDLRNNDSIHRSNIKSCAYIRQWNSFQFWGKTSEISYLKILKVPNLFRCLKKCLRTPINCLWNLSQIYVANIGYV